VQCFVARHRSCRVFLPRLAVLAGWDDSRCPARRDGSVAGSSVIGPDCDDHAEELISRDLVKQIGQHGRIADPATGDLDGPYFQRNRINPEVNFAPVARLRRAVFFGQPLAIAFGVNARAVDRHVQGVGAGTTGDVENQGLLAAAKSSEVQYRPLKSGKIEQTCHHPGRLPQRHPEERLQRQAGLDRGNGKDGLTTAPATRCGQPLWLRIEPNRQ
jgi:hypothetical protein